MFGSSGFAGVCGIWVKYDAVITGLLLYCPTFLSVWLCQIVDFAKLYCGNLFSFGLFLLFFTLYGLYIAVFLYFCTKMEILESKGR